LNLPGELNAAIGAWMTEHGRGSLAGVSHNLSEVYKKGEISSHVSLAAYIATRVPATFASNTAVQAALAAAMPDFAPTSLLDIGAGPGVASWAALNAHTSLQHVTLCEQDKNFAELAMKLNAQSAVPQLQSSDVILKSEATLSSEVSADLVVVSYMLAELPLASMASMAARLMARASQILILIEPGTPQGFARLKVMRDVLQRQGVYVVAPCTHQEQCPMVARPPQSFGQLPQQVGGADTPSLSSAGGGARRAEGDDLATDWCHFKTRLQRSREHMHAKGGTVPFEDEAFSYLILSRQIQAQSAARIIAPPTASKHDVTLRLCDATGLRNESIASRNKPTYKRAQKKTWGQVWE
jgi:ribosomal protein RSM22 (predicted rRNA methylase)